MRLQFPIVVLIVAGGVISYLVYDYTSEWAERRRRTQQLRAEISSRRSNLPEREPEETGTAPTDGIDTDRPTLVVQTVPEGALVTTETDTLGLTPFARRDIGLGLIRMRFHRSGFVQSDTFVVLTSSRPETVSVRLEPNTALGEPASTRDVSPGRTLPIAGDSSLGESTNPTDVDAPAREKATLPPEESESTSAGSIRVQVRPWGTIRIGGSIVAESTDQQYESEISAGAHWLHVSHPALGHFFRELRISPSTSTEVEVDLGTLNRLSVQTTSSDRFVFVDGHPTGLTTPCVLRLPDGIHQIAVGDRPTGSLLAERDVEVGPGNSDEITFRLTADSTTSQVP